MRTSLQISVLLLLLSACGAPQKISEAEPSPRPQTRTQEQNQAKTQEGLASWYGNRFKGRKTASGERFDPTKLTAAHRSLPFGTKVRVIRLDSKVGTEKSVIVTINDRGPFSPKRIIDVSHAAAKALGIVAAGVARVRIETL